MEIVCASIGYIIGIIGGLYLDKNIVPLLLLFPIITIYLKKQRKIILITFLFALIGSSYLLVLENNYQTTYPEKLEKLEVIARVVSDEKQTEYQKQYTVKILTGKYKNTHLILRMKKENPSFYYGESIKIIGNFEKAAKQRNEGGFDYRQYLKTKKIHGIVTAQKLEKCKNKENLIDEIDKSIHLLAVGIEKKLVEIMGKEQSHLLAGILIGRTNELPEEIKENFKISNLTHMLAVSGAHVSYVLLLLNFILSKIKLRKKKAKSSIYFYSPLFYDINRKNSLCAKSLFYEYLYYSWRNVMEKNTSTYLY